MAEPKEAVDHPDHYGGEGNPYEAIKVIDAWGLGFALGNAVKYIARHRRKGKPLEDLRKAAWYLNHAIELLASGQVPADKLASHVVPLEQIDEAFKLMESGEALRVVLKP